MGVIEDNKEYLKHKHQGGISSSKGNTNEDFYATYQLASYMADIHPEDVILYGQKENSFVDDLYIDAHGTNIYVQVKAVKSLMRISLQWYRHSGELVLRGVGAWYRI